MSKILDKIFDKLASMFNNTRSVKFGYNDTYNSFNIDIAKMDGDAVSINNISSSGTPKITYLVGGVYDSSTNVDWGTIITDKALKSFSVVATNHYGSGAANTTKTFTLTAGLYVLVVGGLNISNADQLGLWLVSAHANSGMVRAVASTTRVTVSINKLTLSVKLNADWTMVSLFKVCNV